MIIHFYNECVQHLFGWEGVSEREQRERACEREGVILNNNKLHYNNQRTVTSVLYTHTTQHNTIQHNTTQYSTSHAITIIPPSSCTDRTISIYEIKLNEHF